MPLTTPGVLVARQPIYDSRLQVVAYEILYRSAEQRDRALIVDGDTATAKVAVNAILDIGLDVLVGPGQAFINVTRSVMLQDLYDFLPPGRVVLELLEDIEPDPEVLAAIARAKARGFSIALDDFAGETHKSALIERADYVKLDLPRIAPGELARIVDGLRRPRLSLLAEKVETHEVFETCKRAGFDLFQGYFFARPQLMHGRRLPADRMALMQLLARVQDERADIDEIERLVAANVGLSYKLLRYVNSALLGVSRRIESIRHAVLMLGLERVRTCVMMLVLAGLDDKPHELVVTALVRARHCQLLAALEGRDSTHKYFTVGLLSVLDAFMDRPLDELVAELHFTPEIEAALLRHEGPLGEALEAAIACERADWPKVLATSVAPELVGTAYVRALDWTAETDAALTGTAT